MNKNPIAEKAVQELSTELLKVAPEGRVSQEILAKAVSFLNSRVRFARRSARELWMKRDQYDHSPIEVDDKALIEIQHGIRCKSHPEPFRDPLEVNPGDIVFLKSEHDKIRARCKYVVVDVLGSMVKVRKFGCSQFRARTYEVPCSNLYRVPVVNRASDSGSEVEYNKEEVDDVGQSEPHAIVNHDVSPQEIVNHDVIPREIVNRDVIPQVIVNHDVTRLVSPKELVKDDNTRESSDDEDLVRGAACRYPVRRRNPRKFLTENYHMDI